MVKRALIVTPTSLVSNWESEINKWVGGRLKIIALCESTRADVVSGIDSFLRPLSPFQVNIYDKQLLVSIIWWKLPRLFNTRKK